MNKGTYLFRKLRARKIFSLQKREKGKNGKNIWDGISEHLQKLYLILKNRENGL
jgi:hypothetical protein